MLFGQFLLALYVFAPILQIIYGRGTYHDIATASIVAINVIAACLLVGGAVMFLASRMKH